MLIKRQTILNRKMAIEPQQDTSDLSFGKPGGSWGYVGSSNCGSMSVGAGADWDTRTITPTFAPNSLAYGVASGCGGHAETWDAYCFKIRLYMGGVQVAESGYFPYWGDSDIATYIRAAHGFRALSGSQTCKCTVHNYDTVSRSFCVAMGTSAGGYGMFCVAVGSVKC